MRKLWDPEWTAQFSEWETTGKDSSEACAIACQNCVVYSVFPSGLASRSKTAQFNWEYIVPFRQIPHKWLSNLNWILLQTDDIPIEGMQYNQQQIILSIIYSNAYKLSLTHHTNMLLQTYKTEQTLSNI